MHDIHPWLCVHTPMSICRIQSCVYAYSWNIPRLIHTVNHSSCMSYIAIFFFLYGVHSRSYTRYTSSLITSISATPIYDSITPTCNQPTPKYYAYVLPVTVMEDFCICLSCKLNLHGPERYSWDHRVSPGQPRWLKITREHFGFT